MATKQHEQEDHEARVIEDMIQTQIIFANRFGRDVTEIRLSPPLMAIFVEYVKRTVVFPQDSKIGMQLTTYMGIPIAMQDDLSYAFPVEIHCQPLINTVKP